MEPWMQEVLLPIVLAVLASNGLWALIGKRRDNFCVWCNCGRWQSGQLVHGWRCRRFRRWWRCHLFYKRRART